MVMLQRTVSILLALVMVFTMLPVSALATESESVAAETEPVGKAALDIPEETIAEIETTGAGIPDGPETAETEPVETVPETTAPEVFVEKTAAMSNAEEAATSGSCGENLTWSFDETTGTLTISGEGEMEDYLNSHQDRAPWFGYRDSITSIIIEHGVTTIGTYAFDECEEVISAEIPDSVASIGALAFNGCSFTSIAIPSGVVDIGHGAFSGCTALTSVILPDSLCNIGSSAFSNCWSLDSITIPEGVISVENATFQNCSALTNVILPDGLSSISTMAFRGCESLSKITIPEGVTIIRRATFYECKNLEEVILPDSIHTIEDEAFQYCYNLKQIEFPDSIGAIGKKLFTVVEVLRNLRSRMA